MFNFLLYVIIIILSILVIIIALLLAYKLYLGMLFGSFLDKYINMIPIIGSSLVYNKIESEEVKPAETTTEPFVNKHAVYGSPSINQPDIPVLTNKMLQRQKMNPGSHGNVCAWTPGACDLENKSAASEFKKLYKTDYDNMDTQNSNEIFKKINQQMIDQEPNARMIFRNNSTVNGNNMLENILKGSSNPLILENPESLGTKGKIV